MILLVGTVTAFEFDNWKDSYDEKTKTIVIKNAFTFGDEILSSTLNTPQNNSVGIGEEIKVAQFTINPKQDYENVINGIECYDLNDDNKEIDCNIDVKYLSYEDRVVDKYKETCNTLENKTTECFNQKSGKKVIQEEVWKDFNNSVKLNKEVVIGLFTTTYEGQRVEFVPELVGVPVKEWAGWDASLNVGLERWFMMEETSGTVVVDFNETLNGSSSGVTLSHPGIINSGYLFETGDSINLTDVLLPATADFSFNFWFNVSGDIATLQYIFHQVAGFEITDRVYLYLNSSIIRFIQQDMAGLGLFVYEADAWASDYHMITVIRDGSNFTLYVDGVNKISVSESSAISQVQHTYIGASGSFDILSNIGIDEFGFWSRVLTSEEVTLLYNEGAGNNPLNIILVPTVTDIYPVNDSNFTTSSVTANATVSDGANLTKVEWYINGVLNQTNSSMGLYNNSVFTFSVDLAEGTHTLQFNATNNVSQSTTGNLIYVNIDTIPPALNITYPLNTTYIYANHTTSDNITIQLNWTVSDVNLDSCWYWNTTTNVSITCGDNATIFLPYGSYTFWVYANDTFGLLSKENVTATWKYVIFENSQEFNNETLEGIVNPFTANITVEESNSITTATLIYNGTSNSGSFSQSGNDSILTIDLLAPDVKADTNLTFFWSLLLSNDQIINLTSYNQTIITLTLDNCSTNTVVLYNYTVVDEGNQSILSNTVTELNINLLNMERQDYISNFSLKYTSENPFAVCINTNLSSSTYLVDSVVKYEATGYAIEYYNIVNSTITNSTIPEEITLYDLISSEATEFKITFKAEDFTFVEDALIYIDRQYIAENNTFKTVELPKTDSNGQTVGHFVRNDIVYNIRVIKDGEVLGNFKNMIAFCEDYAIGDCQIILEATPEDLTIFNYDEQLGIIFQSVPTYNENTSTISFDFSTDDGTIKTVFMDVTRDDIFGNRTICNNTVTSSSGTLSCSHDPSIDDSVLRVNIFVEGQPIIFSSVKLEGSDYGNLGYVLWFFLTFLFILLFGNSKTEVLIGLLVSFMGAITLGITRGNIIGFGSAGIWLLVIVILGIWKLNKEKPQ